MTTSVIKYREHTQNTHFVASPETGEAVMTGESVKENRSEATLCGGGRLGTGL